MDTVTDKTILKKAISALGVGAILLVPQSDHKLSVVRTTAHVVSKDENVTLEVKSTEYAGFYAVQRVANK